MRPPLFRSISKMFAALAAAAAEGFEEQQAPVVPRQRDRKRKPKTVTEVIQNLLPDPLAVLEAKDHYIQAAAAAAQSAKEAAIRIILQNATATATATPATDGTSATATATAAAAATAAVGLPALQTEPPNLPAVRPGLADLRSNFHKAIKEGNTYYSPETIQLSIELPGNQTPEASIKPQPNFELYAARTQDTLRPQSLKDAAMGAATGVMEAIRQPIDPRTAAGIDPFLGAATPARPPEKEFENYNFCGEMKRGTLTPSVPLNCIQEKFIASGGKETGLLYPTKGGSAYYTFYSQPTYGDMLLLIENLVTRIHSANKKEQATARAQLYGDISPAKPLEQGAEIFMRIGPQRLLVRRRILKDGLAVPPLLAHDIAGGAADFLLVTSIWSEGPRRWKWAQKTGKGMTTIVEKELWDFEKEHADMPGDFRNLLGGKYIANSITPLRPLTPNYLRTLWTGSPEDEILIEDADDPLAHTTEPQAIPKELLFLSQEAAAPMLNFAVRSRDRGEPPAGVYSQPQFLETFGSGRRFEELRNPDIFYSLTHSVEIDTRPRTDLPDHEALAVFRSKSFWQCTSPISPAAWRTITMSVLFDSLPTAGPQPMRCVAAAYPFFLYLAYTPAAAGVKQGVYLYLYRLKDNSYMRSNVNIQKSVMYFISIDYTDGAPGRLRLQVAPMAAARADVSQLEKSAVDLEVHDDVFLSMMPVEGGTLYHAIQLPFISLGFQKYGLGAAGMNGRVGYFHVFDYKLAAEQYRKEVAGAWQIGWYN